MGHQEDITPERSWLWTPSHRKVLIGFILLASIGYLVCLYFNPQYIPKPQPPKGLRASELQAKLDPNTADWQTLALIPNLGESRAKQIAAYRDEFRSTRPDKIPFQSPDDLLKVKTIGVSTVEQITPYLSFPTTQSTD